MKLLLYSCILALIFTGCHAPEVAMPKGKLMKVSYSYGSQMLPDPEISFTIAKENDEIFIISYNLDSLHYSRYLSGDEQLLDKVQKVIESNEMYAYQPVYDNPVVLDGDYWFFEANYLDTTNQNEQKLTSHGCNSEPKDDGFAQIKYLYKETLQHSVWLYKCDAFGIRIIEDTVESSD